MQLSKPRVIYYLLLLSLALPVKGQYDFSVNDTEGCTPMKVKYAFTCVVDTFTSFYWDFGNGETSYLRDPDTIVYTLPGFYTPALVFNNRGDQMMVKPSLIEAHHVVGADFSSKDTISDQVYVFEHTEPLDTGVDYTFTWDIDIPGFTPGNSQRQIVTFPDSGVYTVSLTVADEFGCLSTSSTVISIIEEITIQNVFTPNDDQINDNFIVTSNGGFPIIVKIFTRAGILVYEGEGTTVTWDGLTASGQKLKPGIYFYAIKALNGDPEKKYTKAGVLYMYE